MENFKEYVKIDSKYDFDNLRKEIKEYFEMITNLTGKVGKKLNRPKEEMLEEFSLSEENLDDPLFIPEMIDLAYQIKENNFNFFCDGWITYGYNHYSHAYRIKGLFFNF